jgi:hypothetical protein
MSTRPVCSLQIQRASCANNQPRHAAWSDAAIDSCLVFTVAQRDTLREHLLRLAEADEHVVAAAAVGSLAADGGDRFSDLDLSFGIADDVPVAEVLSAWTRTLIDQLDAVHLADLQRGPTTYRVFLFPDALQVDLSMTPAAQFRPAGPRFRLLFGATAAGESQVSTPPVAGGLFLPTPPVAGDLFGWGVIYALHARACIERGRLWQAEHYVGAVRDHALSLPASARGCPRCRRAATTTSQQRPWPGSRRPTLARSTLGRSGQPSPPACLRSCAPAPRRVSRTPIPSPSAWLSLADEPQLNLAACLPCPSHLHSSMLLAPADEGLVVRPHDQVATSTSTSPYHSKRPTSSAF